CLSCPAPQSVNPRMDYLQLWRDLEPAHWARAAFSLAVVALLIPLTLPLARRWGLLDNPGGRKDHACPIPVTGGAVILLAIVAGFFVFEPNWNLRVATFLGGALGLVVIGQLDDKYDLRWTWRIGAQALAALALFWLAGVKAHNLQDIFGFGAAN